MPLRIIPHHMEKYVDPYPNSDCVCSDCKDRYSINHNFAYAPSMSGSGLKCSICDWDRPKFGLFYSIPKCELRNIKIDLINGI